MGELRKSEDSEPPPVEPSSSESDLALTIGWDPCEKGGASFCTRKLTRDGADRWRFRPTVGVIAFSLVFICLGVLSFGGWILTRLASLPSSATVTAVLLLTAVLFAGGGGAMLRGSTEPIVFDLKRGIHWKGRGEPRPENQIELSSVHALQIVSEYVYGRSSEGGSFVSYELNLVLKNGDRLNVIDHGNHEQLRRDARSLAEVLAIPLWERS